MENFIALLESGTVGKVVLDSVCSQDPQEFIGEPITVTAHDENGFTFEETGILKAVL